MRTRNARPAAIQFPIDILKIGQSFIAAINDRDVIVAMVHGVLELANILKLDTVAGGIEHCAQLDQLRHHHCRFGQGFLSSRTLPAEQAERFLERNLAPSRNGLASPTAAAASPG